MFPEFILERVIELPAETLSVRVMREVNGDFTGMLIGRPGLERPRISVALNEPVFFQDEIGIFFKRIFYAGAEVSRRGDFALVGNGRMDDVLRVYFQQTLRVLRDCASYN